MVLTYCQFCGKVLANYNPHISTFWTAASVTVCQKYKTCLDQHIGLLTHCSTTTAVITECIELRGQVHFISGPSYHANCVVGDPLIYLSCITYFP